MPIRPARAQCAESWPEPVVDNERRPEAPIETLTKGSRNMITVPTDICRDQLARIETILDRIVSSLAPLAGAR